jgi:hypothetical protein
LDTSTINPKQKQFEFIVYPSIVDPENTEVNFYCVSDKRKNAQLLVFDALGNILFKSVCTIYISKKPLLLGSCELKNVIHGNKIGSGVYLVVLKCKDESGKIEILKKYVGIKSTLK